VTSSSTGTFYWWGGYVRGAGDLIIQGKVIALSSARHYMDGTVLLIDEGKATWLNGSVILTLGTTAR
jgi:hypothetical protein